MQGKECVRKAVHHFFCSVVAGWQCEQGLQDKQQGNQGNQLGEHLQPEKGDDGADNPVAGEQISHGHTAENGCDDQEKAGRQQKQYQQEKAGKLRILSQGAQENGRNILSGQQAENDEHNKKIQDAPEHSCKKTGQQKLSGGYRQRIGQVTLTGKNCPVKPDPYIQVRIKSCAGRQQDTENASHSSDHRNRKRLRQVSDAKKDQGPQEQKSMEEQQYGAGIAHFIAE